MGINHYTHCNEVSIAAKTLHVMKVKQGRYAETILSLCALTNQIFFYFSGKLSKTISDLKIYWMVKEYKLGQKYLFKIYLRYISGAYLIFYNLTLKWIPGYLVYLDKNIPICEEEEYLEMAYLRYDAHTTMALMPLYLKTSLNMTLGL